MISPSAEVATKVSVLGDFSQKVVDSDPKYRLMTKCVKAKVKN
jgi:hypothetical protein